MSTSATAFERAPFDAVLARATPGVEAAEWLVAAAAAASPAGRVLLSQAAASLVNRGWISSLDALLEQAAAHGDHPPEALRPELAALVRSGLLRLADDKIVEIAGCLSTRPTGWRFAPEGGAQLHLLGPLAALGVARGLGRPGVVSGRCGGGELKVELRCDSAGIHSRAPETLSMFLPSWGAHAHPVDVIAAGLIFADDDALAAWQSEAGEPDGMPVASYLFPFAATDLGDRVGAALESLLDALATFD